VLEKYMESWIQRGSVFMAKELDDLAFEISARCFVGANDPGHVHKLRTIAGGASTLSVSGDPAVSAAVRDALLEMIDEEMESEMQIGDAEDEHALDFLMQGEMNLEDIKIELAHFLLKGRDSLGRALKCFMLAMCQEEAVRQGVEEEVAKVTAESEDYAVHGNMVYTGQVIKEVKRAHQLGPLAWRVVTEDTKVGDTQIIAGTRVVLSPAETHKDAKQYTDPDKFDPARFMKDRAEDKQNQGWCYVAHGAGVVGKGHRCPAEQFTAQAMKHFAIVMSTKCNWTTVDGQDFTLDDSLTPKDQLHLQIIAK